jgi:CheY-like chemotaxis protein
MAKRILVVDDERDVQQGIAEMLKMRKYEVLTADDGVQALDILSSEELDLIILDVLLPEIGGKQILVKVKEIEPDTPIIVITGQLHTDRANPEKFAREHGADAFLRKPILDTDLFPLVENLIKKRQ